MGYLRLHHVTLVKSLRQIGFSGTCGSKGVWSYRSLHLGNHGTSKDGLDRSGSLLASSDCSGWDIGVGDNFRYFVTAREFTLLEFKFSFHFFGVLH